MSALGWRQSSTVLESVGEERRLVTPWSGVELYPCTAHRTALGAFLVRAASQPSWNSAVQDITHASHVSQCLTIFNISPCRNCPLFSAKYCALHGQTGCQTWLTCLQEILSVTGLCNSIQLHISLSGYLLHLSTQLRFSLSIVPSFSI